MNESILIVEDEKALRMTLSDRLLNDGYKVECAADGDEGVRLATRDRFDLIILDVMLPRRSGFDVCRDLRHAGLTVPILMLTARGQVADKVVGLKLGADDYLTKPFDMMELTARIEALLRRGAQHAGAATGVQQIGDLRLDFRGTQVSRRGKPVNLSAREFQLLRFMVEHRGETLSRDTILKEVWGYSTETFTRTVDVHIATLRQKLERDPRSPQLILTVQGLGYKFAS
jgi:two-component system, OmpR family, alkaline phosphatase synthesis response regulator PhoP